MLHLNFMVQIYDEKVATWSGAGPTGFACPRDVDFRSVSKHLYLKCACTETKGQDKNESWALSFLFGIMTTLCCQHGLDVGTASCIVLKN